MEKVLWFSGIEGEDRFKRWYDTGKLWIHSFYKNGKLEGEHKEWHENGQLSIHRFHKNGELVKDYLK